MNAYLLHTGFTGAVVKGAFHLRLWGAPFNTGLFQPVLVIQKFIHELLNLKNKKKKHYRVSVRMNSQEDFQSSSFLTHNSMSKHFDSEHNSKFTGFYLENCLVYRKNPLNYTMHWQISKCDFRGGVRGWHTKMTKSIPPVKPPSPLIIPIRLTVLFIM